MKTQATISCVVTGLTMTLNMVTWQMPKEDGKTKINNGTDGYLIDEGTFQEDSNSQTTVLTIPADFNTADAVYTCIIYSTEHLKTADSPEITPVKSQVFSKSTSFYTVYTLGGFPTTKSDPEF